MGLWICCSLVLFSFKFSLLSFLGVVMYDNDFERKENKILNKGKIEPQQIHALTGRSDS